jgi:hypothetical protein
MLTTMANIAKSQERQTSVHEFSAALTGGVSSFKYKLDAGSRSIGFSGGIETGYAYNFNERWGLSAGLGLSIYSSKMSLNNNFSKTYPAIDENGHSFDFTYSLSGYHEKQIVAMLYVPLMARYIIPLGAGKLKYVAAGGVKIQFPLETSIRAVINPGTVTTTGYYSYEDRTYANLPHHGFVNGRSMAQLRKDIDLSVVPMLALETGIRFPVGNNNIDLRVYFDHSLTNVRKSGDAHLVEYQSSNPSQFKYHSVVNTVLVDKVGLFGMGMKIGINF